MIPQALIAAPPRPSPACTLDPHCRRRLALVVTSTTAMLAGLVIGYALGLRQSFQRTLTPRGRDGV